MYLFSLFLSAKSHRLNFTPQVFFFLSRQKRDEKCHLSGLHCTKHPQKLFKRKTFLFSQYAWDSLILCQQPCTHGHNLRKECLLKKEKGDALSLNSNVHPVSVLKLTQLSRQARPITQHRPWRTEKAQYLYLGLAAAAPEFDSSVLAVYLRSARVVSSQPPRLFSGANSRISSLLRPLLAR